MIRGRSKWSPPSIIEVGEERGEGKKSVVKLDLQNEQTGELDFWRRERNAERLGVGLFSLFGGVGLRARTQYQWHYSHKVVCESLSVD